MDIKYKKCHDCINIGADIDFLLIKLSDSLLRSDM
jgi:hypothetical protein